MTSELDRTLERAADSLLGTIAATPPGPARTRPRTAPLLAATALLVVVAVATAAVALWSSADDSRDRVPTTEPDVDADAETPVELPMLLAGWLPDGYELDSLIVNGISTADEMEVGTARGRTTVSYGEPGGDGERGLTQLIVTVEAYPDGSQIEMPAAEAPDETVTVRGRTGIGCRTNCGGAGGGGTFVRWAETPSLVVTMLATSLDLDQLLELAEGVVVDGPGVALGAVPDDIPFALTELSRFGSADPEREMARELPTYDAVYLPADRETGDLGIWLAVAAVMPGHELLQPSSEAARVSIRGHDGWLEIGALSRLLWMESDRVRVEVSIPESTGLGEEDLLAFAEGLREVSQEDWVAALEATHDAEQPIPVDEYAAHIPADAQVSATSDGMGVAAYLAADGRICAYLVDHEGKLPDECGDPAQRVHLLRNRAGQPWMLFGTMPEGAQSVAARVPGYEPMPGTHDVDPGLNPRLYLVALGGELETLDFLTSEGTVVESVPLTGLLDAG